jgi:hypothetical protein
MTKLMFGGNSHDARALMSTLKTKSKRSLRLSCNVQSKRALQYILDRRVQAVFITAVQRLVSNFNILPDPELRLNVVAAIREYLLCSKLGTSKNQSRLASDNRSGDCFDIDANESHDPKHPDPTSYVDGMVEETNQQKQIWKPYAKIVIPAPTVIRMLNGFFNLYRICHYLDDKGKAEIKLALNEWIMQLWVMSDPSAIFDEKFVQVPLHGWIRWLQCIDDRIHHSLYNRLHNNKNKKDDVGKK